MNRKPREKNKKKLHRGLESGKSRSSSEPTETLERKIKKKLHRGVEQLVARRAHNPKVVGSSPAPATKEKSFSFEKDFLFTVIATFPFYVIVQHTYELS